MRTKMIFVECLILVSIISQTVSAETFNIGDQNPETDIEFYTYTSGAILSLNNKEFLNDIPKIFDLNEDTGINLTGMTQNTIMFELAFSHIYNVSNITINPYFEGKSTYYDLYVGYKGVGTNPCLSETKKRTLEINCFLDEISLFIYENGSGNFYFGDLIINYTPIFSDNSTINLEINNLKTIINSLQNKISNLTQQFEDLNLTVNKLNQTQIQLLQNISNLYSVYNNLNESYISLRNELKNLNITVSNDIINLENELISINTDINEIYQSLLNISTDIEHLPDLQDQINKTLLDIENINTNITVLKESIPNEYNDSSLINRIFQLESENSLLKNQLNNLTSEIDNLNKTVDERRTESKEDDDVVAYAAMVLGILGVIIAILALFLGFKRQIQSTQPSDERSLPVIEPEIEHSRVRGQSASGIQRSQPQQPPPQQQPPPPVGIDRIKLGFTQERLPPGK